MLREDPELGDLMLPRAGRVYAVSLGHDALWNALAADYGLVELLLHEAAVFGGQLFANFKILVAQAEHVAGLMSSRPAIDILNPDQRHAARSSDLAACYVVGHALLV